MPRRCDLGIALLANSDPVFYRQPVEPLPDYQEQVISSFSGRKYLQEDMHLIKDRDTGLAEVWHVMRKFCLLVNLGTQTEMLIQPETIYGTMTAVMYRLFRMSFAAGTLDETLRLGLLAFTNHIFLQWQEARHPYHPFSKTYRKYLQTHTLGSTTPSRTALWLLMVGAVSLFNLPKEPWLGDYIRRHIESCGAKTWKEVQDILKSSMWISLLDDKPGKQLYDSLTEMANPG